jgi:hypothetical protein
LDGPTLPKKKPIVCPHNLSDSFLPFLLLLLEKERERKNRL